VPTMMRGGGGWGAPLLLPAPLPLLLIWAVRSSTACMMSCNSAVGGAGGGQHALLGVLCQTRNFEIRRASFDSVYGTSTAQQAHTMHPSSSHSPAMLMPPSTNRMTVEQSLGLGPACSPKRPSPLRSRPDSEVAPACRSGRGWSRRIASAGRQHEWRSGNVSWGD
jgi:hypothetical protein